MGANMQKMMKHALSPESEENERAAARILKKITGKEADGNAKK